MRTFLKRYGFYSATLIIFVAGFIFWQSDLTSDPPMYYSGLGQSLSTDPAQYIFHARNKVLFGQFDPYHHPRWTVYQHSLTSLVGYVWFSLAGVSLQQANMVGVILSFAGLLFLILGVARHHRPWVTAAVAFCFVINVTLFTYGRLPFLENGLILIASLVFFICSRWGNRIRGAALAGGLISLAMLTGKLFGALLFPALLLTVAFSGNSGRWKRAGAAVVSFILVSGATVLLLYGQDIQAAVGYVGEQSYGLRGFPQGLTSPWSFFEHLIAYGFINHLYYIDIDLLLFLFAGIILLILHLNRGNKVSALSPATLFSMFWLLAAVVGLMPLNYSPIRYALLVIPPTIIFCFTTFDISLKVKKTSPAVLGRVETILMVLALWVVLFHTVANIFFFDTSPRPIRTLTWATLPASIGLALLGRTLLRRGYLRMSKRKLIAALLGLLCFSALFNGYQIRRMHLLERNFNTVEANSDIEAILSPEAVVSGPYGPALTVDTRLKSFIHLFGVAEVDSALFDRQPVTHLAVDVSNWAEAIKNYPALSGLSPITSYWVRDTEVQVYNISKVFSNSQARSYQETSFEKAVVYYQSQQYDSALSLAGHFYESHPQSKSTGLLLAGLLWQAGKYNDVLPVMTSLATRFPTDFNIQLQCGRFFQILAQASKDNSLRSLAMQYYEKAVSLNPFRADYARNLWLQTEAQLSGTPGAARP